MSAVARSALAALVAAACGGCSPPDEIVLAVPTDLAVPKDFSALQVQVFEGGTPKFSASYERLGEPDAAALLPATIGFYSSNGGGDAIHVKVSARIEGELGAVRILREANTRIPKNRVALLTLPLNFLCDGSGHDDGSGDVVNTVCSEGHTCVAGACVPSAIDASALPDYSPGSVYGGGDGDGDGDCFDVTACLQGAAPAELDAACSIAGEVGVPLNVALETPAPENGVGDGICDDGDRCLVALDAGGADGFRVEDDGRIQLPPAVCDQVAAGKIAAVVTSPVTAACAQKTAGLPTCGPWSASGSEKP
ncbi:hypothetical protein WME90_14615 [Sorangium sp. So ce375]|uniref:hypothetical protein n=1 Tax=Sorangium sp. So ce375 TaxID=3133306 RepID=UPI003F5AECFF